MTEFNCIGRVGALAVALGVGAVIAPASATVPDDGGPSWRLVAAPAVAAVPAAVPGLSLIHI